MGALLAILIVAGCGDILPIPDPPPTPTALHSVQQKNFVAMP